MTTMTHKELAALTLQLISSANVQVSQIQVVSGIQQWLSAIAGGELVVENAGEEDSPPPPPLA